MKIYHNPRCRKSRETLQIIKEAGIEPEIVEYLKTSPSTTELKSLLEKLQMPAEKLVRKGEKVYKEQYKGKSFSDEEWRQIISENPILMERPVVVTDKKAVIGRPPENVRELL